MAYKKGKGCQPITSKIKYTTKGGMVTQPILNMGAPVKMKMSSPAKQTYNPMQQLRLQAIPSDDLSMTPYSVKREPANYVEKNPKVKKTGVIHGPKVSYDMAYEKAKKTKRYANMSKADYIKEAKRQTKSFTETGNWDAMPKRKKETAAISTSLKTNGISTSNALPTSTVTIKPTTKKVEPTKKQTRKAKSIDKKLTKAKVARDAGNIKKAERKEKRAANKQARINKRVANKKARVSKREENKQARISKREEKKNSPAKNYNNFKSYKVGKGGKR